MQFDSPDALMREVAGQTNRVGGRMNGQAVSGEPISKCSAANAGGWDICWGADVTTKQWPVIWSVIKPIGRLL